LEIMVLSTEHVISKHGRVRREMASRLFALDGAEAAKVDQEPAAAGRHAPRRDTR
jgi:hypothetical protein